VPATWRAAVIFTRYSTASFIGRLFLEQTNREFHLSHCCYQVGLCCVILSELNYCFRLSLYLQMNAYLFNRSTSWQLQITRTPGFAERSPCKIVHQYQISSCVLPITYFGRSAHLAENVAAGVWRSHKAVSVDQSAGNIGEKRCNCYEMRLTVCSLHKPLGCSEWDVAYLFNNTLHAADVALCTNLWESQGMAALNARCCSIFRLMYISGIVHLCT
jgi:hypothetical protein